MAMCVGAYIRVSSKRHQADRWSLPSQRDAIARYCAAQEWPEPLWYVEARSAKEDDPAARPVFGQLLADAAARRFAVLVVVEIDRFARSVVAGLDAAARLERAGIRVVSLNDGNIDPTDPDGEFSFTLKLMLARRENKVRARKTRAGLAAARAAGRHTTTVPYGGIIAPDGTLAVDDRQAAGLRLLLTRAADSSDEATAAALTAAGVPTRHGNAHWQPTAVRSVVRRGRWLVDQPAPWPALWAAATRRAPLPRLAGTATPHLLTGLARCACGGALTHSGGRTPPGQPRRSSLQCRHLRDTSRPNGAGCPYRRHLADFYEPEVARQFLALRLRPTPDDAPDDGREAALAELARRRRVAWLGLDSGQLGEAEYAARVAALDAEEAALPLGARDAALLGRRLAEAQAAWAATTEAGRNALLRQYVRAVIIAGPLLTVVWLPEVEGLRRA